MEHVLKELGKLGRTSLERRAKARQAADLIRAARSTVCQLAQNVGGLMTRILLVGYDPGPRIAPTLPPDGCQLEAGGKAGIRRPKCACCGLAAIASNKRPNLEA
jgi:hypothetical protein